MIIKQIDLDTRVKLKRFHFPAAGGPVFALQKRQRFGWRTVSWNYVSVFRRNNESIEGVISWLFWDLQREKLSDLSYVNKIISK